ncbi:MAG: hypothetical protein LIO65_06470, partial [Odoribacter sp.]|nr:hypothetical protein [Odoribacter sp.]
EGGLFTTTYSILKDTTFRLNKDFQECCSATGYDTKIGTFMTSLCELQPDGYMVTTAITKMEFKSPFFDPSFISRMNSRFKGDFRDYPDIENKYEFSLDNDIQFLELFNPPVTFTFYFDSDENGRIYPIFETYDKNEKLVDKFILNSRNYNQIKSVGSNQKNTNQDNLIQCPVLIYTTLGRVEIKPDGYFAAK